MHRITTAPIASIPARTRWAVAVGVGAALAAAWWLGETAPRPYAQRGLLDVPFPFLTADRMDAVLQPRPGGSGSWRSARGPACIRCTSPRSSGRRDGSMCSTSSRRCSIT